MSYTTKHHVVNAANLPTDQVGQRRRKRLSDLLARRDLLASGWTEAMAHGLPSAATLLHDLAIVERALGHCWPAVYRRQLRSWVERDAALIHSELTPHPMCSVCTTSTSVEVAEPAEAA